jgi:hypothetical protein
MRRFGKRRPRAQRPTNWYGRLDGPPDRTQATGRRGPHPSGSAPRQSRREPINPE